MILTVKNQNADGFIYILQMYSNCYKFNLITVYEPIIIVSILTKIKFALPTDLK